MWLNKKEVFVGNNLEDYQNCIKALEAGSIKYKPKVVANDGAEFSIFSMFFRYGRRARGSYGQDPDYMKTYYVYVDPKDYDEAMYLLNK
ncbi:MAG: hypothetical protein ACLRVU_11035 [Beduini sp.]|uniref:hypothetical protein n=1 Tax=Beduini sp. TaxID=1922300 RepID=UPI00399F8344